MSVINFCNRNGPRDRPVWRFNLGHSKNEALQLTFSYFTYSQLRRCMLVSKSWRKLALEELQARCSVRISNDEHVKIILQKLNTNPNFRVGNLTINPISVDAPLLDKLFLKARQSLHFLKLESPVEIQEGTLFKILRNLSTLTHLSVTTSHNSPDNTKSTYESNRNENPLRSPELSGRYWTDEELSTQTEDDVDVIHPNVRHLHLDLGQGVTFQLSKIFHSFPNLYELAIANATEESRKYFKSDPSASSTLASSHSLKYLTLRQYSNTGFTEKLVETLMRLNMHLEKLVLIFHPPSSSYSSKLTQASGSLLRQFIESQGESLQSLKLAQVEDDLWSVGKLNSSITWHANPTLTASSPTLVNYSWNFNYSSPSISLLPMSLPNLRILHVQKPLITNLAQVLNHFPQLRELSVQVSYGSNWKGMLPAKLEPHRNITRLKIDFIDSESFSRLGCCFPSLQTLQLTYCDKSLFTVLADFIPFFNKGNSNARVAKENIFSCLQCHGITEEVSYGTGDNDGIIQNNESFMKGTGVPDTSFDGRSFQNDLEEMEAAVRAGIERKTRRKHALRLLTRLRIRSCAHLPFENFVFLPRERQIQGCNSDFSTPSLENGETFDNEIDDAQEKFSWTMFGTLKNEEFADLPLSSSDDNESCSSA